jgi:hypothetical protein
MDPLTGLAVGGGISLLGGLLGGSSNAAQARADRQTAQEQRDAEERNAVMENYSRLLALYGDEDRAMTELSRTLTQPQRDRFLGRASRAGSVTDQDRARLAELDREEAEFNRGGPNRQGYFGRAPGQRNAQSNRLAELRAERNAIMARSQGDPGVTGLIGRTGFRDSGGGLLGEYQQLMGLSDARTGDLLSKYREGSGQLDQGFGALEALAQQYGQGQEDRIRRDAGDQEKRLNQNATARLAASGLTGSTLMSQALTSNSRSVNRDAQDRILDLNDSVLDRRLGIGSQRLGAMQSRLAGEAGILGTGEDRFFSLAQQPLNLKTQVQLNPRMPNITPLSSASPSAAFGSTLANSLAAPAGMLTGLSFQQMLSQDGKKKGP